MKSYNDLFYFKTQKDKTKAILDDLATLESNLIFYDNEINLTNIRQSYTNLSNLYKELVLLVDEEKGKFTKEELKELSLIYKDYK